MGGAFRMKKSRIIVAAVLVLIGIVLNFAFTGHSFIAYTLYFVAALVVVFGLAGKKLKRIICILLALGIAYFITVEAFIVSAASGDSDDDYDYIIVLGAAVRGDTPSRSLVERMEAARGYLLRHPDTVAIVSGGQGDGENLSEGLTMYKWLTAHGIAGSRIIIEDKATSTYENLKCSFDIIDSQDDLASPAVAVVTSEYHIYRAKLLASSQGFEIGGIAADTGLLPVKLNYFIREAFGVTYQWIFG